MSAVVDRVKLGELIDAAFKKYDVDRNGTLDRS